MLHFSVSSSWVRNRHSETYLTRGISFSENHGHTQALCVGNAEVAGACSTGLNGICKINLMYNRDLSLFPPGGQQQEYPDVKTNMLPIISLRGGYCL